MDKSHAIGCLLQISNSSTLQGGFNLFADATLFGITFWAESFLCRVTKKIIQTVKWVMTSFHLPIKNTTSKGVLSSFCKNDLHHTYQSFILSDSLSSLKGGLLFFSFLRKQNHVNCYAIGINIKVFPIKNLR